MSLIEIEKRRLARMDRTIDTCLKATPTLIETGETEHAVGSMSMIAWTLVEATLLRAKIGAMEAGSSLVFADVYVSASLWAWAGQNRNGLPSWDGTLTVLLNPHLSVLAWVDRNSLEDSVDCV